MGLCIFISLMFTGLVGFRSTCLINNVVFVMFFTEASIDDAIWMAQSKSAADFSKVKTPALKLTVRFFLHTQFESARRFPF